MHRILCSTGALIGRPNNRDFTLLNFCHGKIACDGYEFLMYDTWYNCSDELKQFVNRFPASFPVFHIEKSVGDLISRNQAGDTEKALALFDCNCSLASAFGSEKLVLHLWGGLDSDKNIAHNYACYKYLREISDSYGLTLTVENVVCNNLDPLSHMINLAQVFPDIQFTYDTKMAAFHNQIDKLYRLENRWLFQKISHMHINDYSGGYKEWANLKTLHIGQGWIDFDQLFEQLHKANYCGDFTLEATSFDMHGNIQFEKLNTSLQRIRNYFC